MAPRYAVLTTTFRTFAFRLRRMASPSRFLPLVFSRLGSLFRRFVRPATAGPAPTRRCPGFSRIPPFSGATLFGAVRITILSPARDTRSTAARLRNGARRDPVPRRRAVALTYQVLLFLFLAAACATAVERPCSVAAPDEVGANAATKAEPTSTATAAPRDPVAFPANGGKICTEQGCVRR